MTDDKKKDECSDFNIQTIGNVVYFSEDIDEGSVMELFTTMRELEIKMQKKKTKYIGFEPAIWLFIKSDGGDIFSGFSAMDFIKSLSVPVYTVADGMCASAATFLLLAGRKRFMTKHTHILIHQLSTEGFWGRYEEIKDEMKNLNKFMDMIQGVYEDTEIPDKKFKKMMKRDLYLNAQKCLKYKIVHDVYEPLWKRSG